MTQEAQDTQVSPSPKWYGSFCGSDLSTQDYDILTIQHIPAKLRKKEQELARMRWFDCRKMHPMLATYYFMECYKTAYQEFTRVAINADTAPYVKPIKGNDFLNAREKLSFWRLRQLVDELGIRYDFFLSEAMRWYTEECFRSESLYPPRPGHMATNADMLASVVIAWEEELNVRMQFPQDECYKIKNFTGSVDQLDYEEFVMKQIMNRQHKQFSLCAALYTHEVLRIRQAELRFGERLVSDAIEEFNTQMKLTNPNQISQ